MMGTNWLIAYSKTKVGLKLQFNLDNVAYLEISENAITIYLVSGMSRTLNFSDWEIKL